MINYLIRRLLLMPITLFGITVMVFLIARCAPGKPGQMQMGGDATLNAEQQQALRQWQEKRYGLDKPLWIQYPTWWKGMFTKEVDALAWTEVPWSKTLVPVLTLRQPPTEYYAKLNDGQWVQTFIDAWPSDFLVDDGSALRSLVREVDLESQPAPREGYAPPTHLFIESATLVPIESLDEDVEDERLERASEMSRVTLDVEAPAWSDRGEPVYRHPTEANTLVVERNDRWFRLTPSQTTVKPVTDVSLQTALGSAHSELPQDEEGYSIPRHALVYGTITPLEETLNAESLERHTVMATVASPAGLWVRPADDEPWVMLWQQAEQIAPLMVRGEQGDWLRLIGETRAQEPAFTKYEQSDPAFRDELDTAALNEFPAAIEEGQRVPRHAVFEGTRVPWLREVSDRQIRRFQAKTSIFELTLGESLTSKRTVMQELKERLPVTLLINLIAFPLIYAIAIPTGMLMAVRRGKWFDGMANFFLLAFWSVPSVLAATLLIGYLSTGGAWIELFPNNGLNSVSAGVFPFDQWLADRAWHLVLPVFCIAYGALAYLAKQMRAAMLDNFTMDYVRTAKAKGVPGKDIVFRHALRNSLLPIITIFATVLPVLIAGSIIIEKIFGIEGMGLLAFRAVQNRDYDVVQSLALIAGILNLSGLLLADMLYALADPRITYR